MRMQRLLPAGLLIGSLLSACSTLPVSSPPQVLSCPKPVVDHPLLLPAEHQSMDALVTFLQTLPPSANVTPPGSMPSPLK